MTSCVLLCSMLGRYAQGGKDFAKAFHWMDTNNDGSLDWGEFSSALKRLAGLNAAEMDCLKQVFDSRCVPDKRR